MEKDFDGWNFQKKRIDRSETMKLYHEGEIWWCVLGVNIGSEQNGKGYRNGRPVLIIKGLSREVCIIVPLTSSNRRGPYHVALEFDSKRLSFAIISQVRLIDTKRLCGVSLLSMHALSMA